MKKNILCAIYLPTGASWLVFVHLVLFLFAFFGESPVHATTITYGDTTITYSSPDMGSVTGDYQSVEPDVVPHFWSTYDGVNLGYSDVLGMSGSVTYDITLDDTGAIFCPDEEGNLVEQKELEMRVYMSLWDEGSGYCISTLHSTTDIEVGQTVSVVVPYSMTYKHTCFGDIYFSRWDTCSSGHTFMEVSYGLDDVFWSYPESNEDMAGGPDANEDTAFDQGGQGTCSTQGLPTYAVNTSFLTLVAEDTDFAYQSFGQRVAMKRTWNMPPAAGGIFGNGWRFAYESTLHAFAYTSGGATVTLGSGQVVPYSVSGSQGQGSGTVTVNYSCQSTGRRPDMTAYVNESNGTASYLVYDKDRRLTSRYEYDRVDTIRGGAIYRIVSVTDDNGNALTIGYDGSGRLVSLTDASNRATSFTYNAQGRVSAMQTFAGTSASYAYDASGNLTAATDLAGNVSTFAYDADKYLISMSTSGKTTTFGYATIAYRKRLSTVTDPLGNVRSYAMVSGETQVTDPGGGTRAFANTRGRTNMIRNPMSQTTSVSYNAAGLATIITYPDGATETFEYDASGNLTRYEDAGNAVTTMTYTGAWDLATLTDPLNNIWTRTYDGKRNLTGLKTPLNRQTTLVYDSKGQLTSLTVPGNAKTSLSYDSHGNLTGAELPTGEDLVFGYDAHGLERVSASDGAGNATTYSYDANRRLTRATLPSSGYHDYNYACCALSSITDPGGATTTLERDALLRITGVVDPLGKTTILAYNADGHLTSATDPLNRVTQLVSDEAGRVTRITAPLGGHVDYSLNDRGLINSLTDQRGKTTTFSYDGRGLLASQTDPLHRLFRLTRDGLGRVTTWTNARNGEVSYVYDADGKVTEKKHGATTVATYSWDTPGFLASVTDSSGTLSFARDASGRVTTATYPDGLTLGLTFDGAGNVATMTYPGGMPVTYTYDAQNRMTRAAFDGKTIDFTYDAAGRMTSETRSNGVTSQYTFDTAGRLTRIGHVKGAATIADLTQTRDAAGQITAESGTAPVGSTLTAELVSAGYDDADKIVAFGSETFTYDFDGNVTAVSGKRTLALSYDNENRVTSLTSGATTKTFLYNGLGDRVRSTSGGATRNFRFDPFGRLAFETNGSGTVTSLYIWVGSRQVAFGTTSDGFTWPLYDRVGSTLALTDGSGTVTAGYAYEPYGAQGGRTGSATSSFTYVGAFGVMDEGDGIYFMKNRYYDAITSRFLQRDPIGFAGGPNLYRYVGNNPVSRIDPLGLMSDIGVERWNTAVQSMSNDEKLFMGMAGLTAVAVGGAVAWAGGAFGATSSAAATSGGATCVSGTTGGTALTANEVALGDSLVTNSGIVERMVHNSLIQRQWYFDYLLSLQNQGRQGNTIIRAIQKYTGQWILDSSSPGAGIPIEQKRILSQIFYWSNRFMQGRPYP